MLHWPQFHLPSPMCWHLWTTMVCSIYTGSSCGTCLTHPLGKWLGTYDATRFWHWQMHDSMHLVYQHFPIPNLSSNPTTMQNYEFFANCFKAISFPWSPNYAIWPYQPWAIIDYQLSQSYKSFLHPHLPGFCYNPTKILHYTPSLATSPL